jgi:hypothetical protein
MLRVRLFQRWIDIHTADEVLRRDLARRIVLLFLLESEIASQSTHPRTFSSLIWPVVHEVAFNFF